MDPNSGTEGPLTIGCNALYGAHFKGKIDEVRIYNRALDISPVSIANMNQLPSCEAPTDQQTVESRKELKDGGYATVYSFEGMTVELPTPPSSFDPLSASAEELEEYGFPPRPTDPEALVEWEADMGHYGSVSSGAEGLCNSEEETETAPEGTQETEEGEGEGEEAKFWTTPIWAGYAAVDYPHPSRWVALEGNYTQPKSHPDSCAASSEVSWIGLGGYALESLIQAGTGIDPENHYYAWFEWLGPEKTGINIHRIKRLGIHPGDQIHVYLSYGQSTHKLNFYIANNTTEKSQPVVFHNFDGARYFNGSTAEWIDERPTINGVPAHLKNFGTVNWSGVRAQENSGTWAKIGNLPHRRLHLTSNGKQLAAPGFLQNEGRAFQDNWIRCHG